MRGIIQSPAYLPVVSVHRQDRLPALLRLALLAVLLLLLIAAPDVPRAQSADLSGDWQTYRQTDSGVSSLSQSGDRVTGRYEPGDAGIEGTVEGACSRRHGSSQAPPGPSSSPSRKTDRC
jgi:hypothetical protein